MVLMKGRAVLILRYAHATGTTRAHTYTHATGTTRAHTYTHATGTTREHTYTHAKGTTYLTPWLAGWPHASLTTLQNLNPGFSLGFSRLQPPGSLPASHPGGEGTLFFWYGCTANVSTWGSTVVVPPKYCLAALYCTVLPPASHLPSTGVYLAVCCRTRL